MSFVRISNGLVVNADKVIAVQALNTAGDETIRIDFVGGTWVFVTCEKKDVDNVLNMIRDALNREENK